MNSKSLIYLHNCYRKKQGNPTAISVVDLIHDILVGSRACCSCTGSQHFSSLASLHYLHQPLHTFFNPHPAIQYQTVRATAFCKSTTSPCREMCTADLWFNHYVVVHQVPKFLFYIANVSEELKFKYLAKQWSLEKIHLPIIC